MEYLAGTSVEGCSSAAQVTTSKVAIASLRPFLAGPLVWVCVEQEREDDLISSRHLNNLHDCLEIFQDRLAITVSTIV